MLKLFTIEKANVSWETDAQIISDKQENVEKAVNIHYNSNDSNSDGFAALNLHDEKDIFQEEGNSKELFKICNDDDNTGRITKLLFVLAIVSLVVLAIAFYWELSQGITKNYPHNGAFL